MCGFGSPIEPPSHIQSPPNDVKISVLMPYRNEAAYLQACLDSLTRQTLSAYELVAVDDGSTDGSPQIVESFAHRFENLIHLKTGGKGLVEALNTGLAHATGTLIARADGDDLYHPHRLELQQRMIDSGADVVGSLVRFFPRTHLMEGFSIYEEWINRLQSPSTIASEIYVETPIAHPSLLIRKDLIMDLGGYRCVSWPEDFDLMLRAYLSGATFKKVPRVLHFWREHPERLCRTDSRYSLEAFIQCRCHHLVRGPLSDGRALVLWGAGPIGKKTAACLIEENRAFEAFVDIDPKKIGGTVKGRKVFDPGLLKDRSFFVLSCVGKRGARYLIKSELEAMGYRDRLDFILAA